MWDIETKKLVKELPTQNHWVRALVTSDKYLYSGSYQAVKVTGIHFLDIVSNLSWILKSLEFSQSYF